MSDKTMMLLLNAIAKLQSELQEKEMLVSAYERALAIKDVRLHESTVLLHRWWQSKAGDERGMPFFETGAFLSGAPAREAEPLRGALRDDGPFGPDPETRRADSAESTLAAVAGIVHEYARDDQPAANCFYRIRDILRTRALGTGEKGASDGG
jgi:hypothetical protein